MRLKLKLLSRPHAENCDNLIAPTWSYLGAAVVPLEAADVKKMRFVETNFLIGALSSIPNGQGALSGAYSEQVVKPVNAVNFSYVVVDFFNLSPPW